MTEMTFSDYINSLPNQRQDTIKKIAEITCSSRNVVYRWLNGSIEPPLVKKKIISEVLRIPVEVLFPETEGKENNSLKKSRQ